MYGRQGPTATAERDKPIETMLDFASRHNVLPQTEHFPMSKINEAFARLESGKAHYRIVLDADF